MLSRVVYALSGFILFLVEYGIDFFLLAPVPPFGGRFPYFTCSYFVCTQCFSGISVSLDGDLAFVPGAYSSSFPGPVSDLSDMRGGCLSVYVDSVIAHASGTRRAWWIWNCYCLGLMHVGSYTVQLPLKVCWLHTGGTSVSQVEWVPCTLQWGGVVPFQWGLNSDGTRSSIGIPCVPTLP